MSILIGGQGPLYQVSGQTISSHFLALVFIIETREVQNSAKVVLHI